MSARKFVRQQVTSAWPTPTDGQFIAKVKGARGNNLHAIETEEGEEMLVSMPTRFRNNVWMKRGDYIIADPIDEGVEVRAEISCILLKDQIRHLKQTDLWPAKFRDDLPTTAAPAAPEAAAKPSDVAHATESDAAEAAEDGTAYESSSSADDDSDLVQNTNRRHFSEDEESSSEDDD